MKKSTLFGLFIFSDFIALGLFGIAFMQSRESGDLFSNPLVFVALGLFIVVPSVLLVIYSQNSSAASDGEVLRTGTLTYATVLDVRNSGTDQAGLKLQVNPATTPAYETKITVPVTALNPEPYHAGMVIKVRVDPKRPRRVVIDDGSAAVNGQPKPVEAVTSSTTIQIDGKDVANLPPAIQKLIQTALMDADHNGIPDVMEKAGLNSTSVQVMDLSGRLGSKLDPQARIDKLEKLRAAGMINQEMFDLLKSKIEKGAQNQAGM